MFTKYQNTCNTALLSS